MNSRLLLTLVPLAGLFVTGCDKSPPPAEAPAPPKTAAAPAAPVAEPPPVQTPPAPAGPSEKERRSAEQMRAMEVKQAELQQQLEEEKLARLEAEMAAEQALLDRERNSWAAAQESQVANIPQPPAAVHQVLDNGSGYSTSGAACDYQTFYDDLAPYGTWYDSPDYGYCWQPSVYLSDVSWRPYTRGCWNSCDAGWVWCSDEPFGWACYHYGRWVKCSKRGWLWVPGSQWAPAWVCWRKNDDYVGWCPLPPETVYNQNCTWGPTVDRDCGIHPSCYVFVPCKHFDKPVMGYCEAPSVCLRICGTTVNITNIICRPGRVQCEGPQHDWITRCVRRPVPRYTLAWESGREAHGPAHRVVKDRIHFFAPKVEAPWNAALRPRAQAVRLENASFVRDSAGVPEKLASSYRSERSRREKAVAESDNKAVRSIRDRQQRIEEMRKNRETISAEVERYAAVTKRGLASGPQHSEAPAAKAPRAVAVTPQQTGGDVSPGAGLPRADRPGVDGSAPGTNRVTGRRNDTTPRPAAPETGNGTFVPGNNAPADQTAANREATLENARRQAEAADAKRAAAAANRMPREDVSRGRGKLPAENTLPPVAGDAGDRQAAVEAARREAAEAAAAERERLAREQETAQKHRQALADAEAQTAALRERQRQIDQNRAELADQRRAEAAARAAAAAQQAREESDRTAAVKERSRMQESARAAAIAEQQRAAAAEQQRAAAEAENRAELAARQREELERQRAAMEQQRRQQEAQEQAARQEAARREAMERQQQAMEEQRRQQQQQQEQARRQQEESAARQREAEEQQRRAAEENKRQQEEASRREADQRAREANDHKRPR